MPGLRLLSVNARTSTSDRAELAALIESDTPDLVAVHGSPSLLRWRSISASIARMAGLVVLSGGRTGGGNLLLCSLGVDVLDTRDLLFRESSLRSPAGATMAMCEYGGRPFVMVAAHVVGNSAQRLGQVQQLHDALSGFAVGDPPAVLSVEGADRSGTSSSHALGEKRTSLPAGVFVDERITVDDVSRPGVATLGFAPVHVEMTLPD